MNAPRSWAEGQNDNYFGRLLSQYRDLTLKVLVASVLGEDSLKNGSLPNLPLPPGPISLPNELVKAGVECPPCYFRGPSRKEKNNSPKLRSPIGAPYTFRLLLRRGGLHAFPGHVKVGRSALF